MCTYNFWMILSQCECLVLKNCTEPWKKKLFYPLLENFQTDLFTLGAMLATPAKKEKLNIPKINESSIQFLENEIDTMNSQLPPMTHFILPGGHQTVSFCHIARTVCRRAERLAVLLSDQMFVESSILIYLNRLSDYLFVLARKLSKDLVVKEIKWIPEKF